MKKVKYLITFICKPTGFKFKALLPQEDFREDKGFYGLGDTMEEAADHLIEILDNWTSKTYKYIEKPKPHLTRK